MKRKLKFIGIILTVFLVMSMLGCGLNQVQKTPLTAQDVYDEALGFWLDIEKNFKYAYEMSTDIEQAEMLLFANRLYQAKLLLNAWDRHLKGGSPTDTDVDKFLKIKNEMIFMQANKYRDKGGGQ